MSAFDTMKVKWDQNHGDFPSAIPKERERTGSRELLSGKSMKYKTKSIMVEAECFTSNTPKLDSMGTERTGEMFMEYPVFVDEKGPFLMIQTGQGLLRADNGHWLVRELWADGTPTGGVWVPLKPEVFSATYEAA